LLKTSDVDVLLELQPGAKVGLLAFARMERELSAIVSRKVDLNTEGFLSRYLRSEVLKKQRSSM
jgi:hypothetical protein